MRPAPLRPAATVPTAVAQPQRYLTNDEAADYLRLSPRTLEKQRVIGGGPRFRKFGRRVMYAVADLDARPASCDASDDGTSALSWKYRPPGCPVSGAVAIQNSVSAGQSGDLRSSVFM